MLICNILSFEMRAKMICLRPSYHIGLDCLRGEGLAWLIGAVVCSLVAYLGSNCSLARSMDGRISAAAPLALADQLPLSLR